jgi:Skp family chaperone for outer membrane proteins
MLYAPLFVAAGMSAATAATAATATTAVATIASTAMGVVSAVRQSQASAAQAKFQAGMAKNNQNIANMEADQATKRGQQSIIDTNRKYAAMSGTQRANLAASGVDLGEGSALNILEDTNVFNEVDVNRTKQNTANEVWGYQNQANNAQGDARMYMAASSGYSPALSGGSSLLTSAVSVADKWYRYSNGLG